MHGHAVTHLLEKYYPTGQSGQRRNAYPTPVRVKTTLLQNWYQLSDYGVEERGDEVLRLNPKM
jgi:hypothetical protein